MVLYNTSFMNNATNIVDLYIGLGDTVGDPFLIGHLMLFSFFMIFMILAMKQDFTSVIIIDCIITTVLAILFWVVSLVPASTIVYPFVLFLIAIVLMLFMR